MKNATLIDFVIPYVNNNDNVWRKTYIDYCTSHGMNDKVVELYSVRYNGTPFIYNLLKLVKKNMAWINKIYLLLSNEEQVDKSLLPDNVVIVLHKDFIPSQFLPTFNSTTIEMFLWNIPNLGEKFIYANDDMLPIKKLKPTDFFEEDKVKLQLRRILFNQNSSTFAYQCFNNCNSLCSALNISFDGIIVKPIHSFTPMIKSHCKEVFVLLKSYVLPHIMAFRTIKQHNQYIYPLYEYINGNYENGNIDFYYTELKEDYEFNHTIICVNGEKNKMIADKFRKEVDELCK